MTALRQFTYQGHTIGKGTDTHVITVQGLSALPVLSSDIERLGDGQFAGSDRYTGRTITFTTELRPHNDDDLDTQRAALVDAWQVGGGRTETALEFQIPGVAGGGLRRIYCRPRGGAGVTVDRQFTIGRARETFQMHATDPRIFDANQTVVSLQIEDDSGEGLTWPLTWPLDWGQAADGNTAVIDNTGSTVTPLSVTFTGAVQSPTLQNVTTGESFTVLQSLDAGATLEVDTGAGTVLLGGVASRFASLATGSVLFDLSPGVNVLRFSGIGVGATAVVSFRSAWLA